MSPSGRPESIGMAACLVDREGGGRVRYLNHADFSPAAIALLAATTFIVQGARARALRGLSVEPWLETTRMAAVDPLAFNATMNGNGVWRIEHGSVPAGARTLGTFTLLPSGRVSGEWDPETVFEDIAHASRIFGVLAAGARWYDAEVALAHIARKLEATAADVDYTALQVMATMPQALISYGTHRALRRLPTSAEPDAAAGLG